MKKVLMWTPVVLVFSIIMTAIGLAWLVFVQWAWEFMENWRTYSWR